MAVTLVSYVEQKATFLNSLSHKDPPRGKMENAIAFIFPGNYQV
ncbi:hypothetical protein [Calothrix sp. NIES-3974]|nr:hypothetical protein [Calothrix sp. NIES-3974]